MFLSYTYDLPFCLCLCLPFFLHPCLCCLYLSLSFRSLSLALSFNFLLVNKSLGHNSCPSGSLFCTSKFLSHLPNNPPLSTTNHHHHHQYHHATTKQEKQNLLVLYSSHMIRGRPEPLPAEYSAASLFVRQLSIIPIGRVVASFSPDLVFIAACATN